METRHVFVCLEYYDYGNCFSGIYPDSSGLWNDMGCYIPLFVTICQFWSLVFAGGE